MTRVTFLTALTACLPALFVGPAAHAAGPTDRAAAAPAAVVADDKGPPADDAAPPDEKTARAGVDALIRGFTDAHKPATVGLIQEAIDQSIAFGAPAYNAGDRAGCLRFYRRTAESLLAAFPDDAPAGTPPSATEPARKALADMRAAVDRAGRTKNADRGAWSMRLAFDKAHLSADLSAESARALVRMGDEYFRRSQFEEAQDAFESATAALAELDGLTPDRVPPAVRFAPLALGQTLFAQQKFPQATAALLTGLGSMPDWPGVKFDLRGMHTDPAEYEAAMDKLRDATDAADKAADKADAAPAAAKDGAGMHFLLGYQYWFTGKRDAAREQFDQALKADPKHPGAKRFLDAAEAQRRKDAQKV